MHAPLSHAVLGILRGRSSIDLAHATQLYARRVLCPKIIVFYCDCFLAHTQTHTHTQLFGYSRFAISLQKMYVNAVFA